MNKKIIRNLSLILIVSTLFTSCKVLFPTQRMLDDVLPYRETHFYCRADLIPFSKQELKNAKTVYGTELSEFFYAGKDRTDYSEEQRNNFMRKLSYLNHNYKLVRERYEQYNDDMNARSEFSKEYTIADREFNTFYQLDDSPLSDVIKKYNHGGLSGNPAISFELKLDTVKNFNNIYYEGKADIYEHVVIPKKSYENLKLGETITLELPESNKDPKNSNKKSYELKLVATDSLAYREENKTEDTVLFITPQDGISEDRYLINKSGEMIETFLENRDIRILKYARIANGINAETLITSIMQNDDGGGMDDNIIDDIADKIASGGFLNEKYKEKIYSNYVYTDLKGYITTGIDYTSLYYDNEYARQYISTHNNTANEIINQNNNIIATSSNIDIDETLNENQTN